MSQPVYQAEGPGWVGKTISGVLAAISMGVMLSAGSGRGARLIVVPIGFLLMIWLPDTLAPYFGAHTRPKWVSRVGWLLLLTLQVYSLLPWLLG